MREAYENLEENDRRTDKTLKDFQAFVKKKFNDIIGEIEDRNRIIKSMGDRIKSQKNILWLSRDLLLVYALCILTANPVILLDHWEILVGIDLLLAEYCEWIHCPYNYPFPGAEPLPYELGTAWAVRTAFVIAGLSLAVVII